MNRSTLGIMDLKSNQMQTNAWKWRNNVNKTLSTGKLPWTSMDLLEPTWICLKLFEPSSTPIDLLEPPLTSMNLRGPPLISMDLLNLHGPLWASMDIFEPPLTSWSFMDLLEHPWTKCCCNAIKRHHNNVCIWVWFTEEYRNLTSY